MNKSAIILGCCLLAAAFVPLAAAHMTNPTGSATSFGFLGAANPQPCRNQAGNSCDGNDRVSGTYIGPAGPYVDGVGPIEVNDGLTLFPAGVFAAGRALCDLEILSAGDGAEADDAALDETTVDGKGDTNGEIPDGTFDDGGNGGACHTFSQYAESAYNSPGCDGVGHAEDWVGGAGVFINAACDWRTDNTPQSVQQCALNEAISGAEPAVIQACFDGFDAVQFANNRVEAAIATATGQANTVDDFFKCGADSISDGSNAGAGGGQGGDGVAYPALNKGCTSADASAIIFVFAYTTSDGSASVAASGGWID